MPGTKVVDFGVVLGSMLNPVLQVLYLQLFLPLLLHFINSRSNSSASLPLVLLLVWRLHEIRQL